MVEFVMDQIHRLVLIFFPLSLGLIMYENIGDKI